MCTEFCIFDHSLSSSHGTTRAAKWNASSTELTRRSSWAVQYGASKHAAVALTEALHHELSSMPGGERVRLHVLCPALVNTPLMHTSNQTTESRDDLIEGPIDGTKPRGNDVTSRMGTDVMFADKAWQAAMTPEYVADCLFQGIAEGSFYITVGENVESGVKARHAGIQAVLSFHQTRPISGEGVANASKL